MVTPIAVEDLRSGDHACLTFSDGDERLDIVAAFVRDGLEQGEKVVCLTESIPPAQLPREFAERGVPAEDPMRRGQLAVRTTQEAWFGTGTLDATHLVDVVAREVAAARRAGYAGLRMTADMCFAIRPLAAVEQLTVFEAKLSRLFADGLFTAICQYDRQTFDAITLAIAADAHPKAVAATIYHEDPILRICRQHTPPGIRVAGEIDHTQVEPLRDALAESVRLDVNPHVNLAKLRFIDAAAATLVLHAGLGLPRDRHMTVACGGLVHKMLLMVGAGQAPRLHIVETHGDA